MNDDFDDLEARLKKADVSQPVVDSAVLETATTSKTLKLPNPRAFRFGLASVASLAALAVFSTTLPQPGPTIQLASSGFAADSSAEDSMIVDDFPGWLTAYEYTPSTDLSTDGSRGAVYELSLNGDPRARLQDFASLFGEQGRVQLEDYSTDFFPSYYLQTDDSYFSLRWHGSAMINYSSKRNWLPDECYQREEQELLQSDPDSIEECRPLPVVELPSEQVLREQAYELISAAGYPGTKQDLEINRYQWGAEASAAISANGEETAIQWYVSWDQTAQISNVSGHLATIEYVGDYDTISPVEAVDRIQDGYWFGVPASSNYEEGIMESDLQVSSENISESTPEDFNDSEPIPTEPFPEPGEFEEETIEVTVGSAKTVTLLLEDANGKGWLVPGYLLQTNQGWFESVISLQQGVIQPPTSETVQ